MGVGPHRRRSFEPTPRRLTRTLMRWLLWRASQCTDRLRRSDDRCRQDDEGHDDR